MVYHDPTGYADGVDEALKEVTVEQLRILLEQLGTSAEQVKEDLFNLEFGGSLRAQLITYGDPHLSSIQLRAGFSGFDRIEARHLLSWNRRYRFTKAYQDGDNDPVLESDLRMAGITAEAIAAFVRDFGDQVTLFFSYLRMIDANLVE
jgi:hypothetical protein